MRETKDSKGRVKIDDKHSLDIEIDVEKMSKGEGVINSVTPFIVKSTNDQPIPDDEPRVLFRGRDKLALELLKYYHALCKINNATEYQLESVDKIIQEFKDFAESSSTMKQPGSTLGK